MTNPPLTLFDLAPRAFEQNVIQKITNLHLDCLASFLMPKPNYPGQFHSLGTGFYVVWPEDPDVVRLVTAAHVLENFDFEIGRITIGGFRIALGDVGQKNIQTHRDTATWLIPSQYFIRYGITDVAGFPLWDPESANEKFIPTQSFLIMGYPASQNKALDFRHDKEPDRRVMGLAIHSPPQLSELGVLHFPYPGKGVTEPWAGGNITSPHLNGMSGSPCLRIVSDREAGKIGVVLSGVFTERDKMGQRVSAGWLGDPWLVPQQR